MSFAFPFGRLLAVR